jgi:hypothetical protein
MRYLYVLREIFATLFCSLSIGCSIWFMVMLAQEYNDNEQRKKERCILIKDVPARNSRVFSCWFDLLDSEWYEKPENPPPRPGPQAPGVPPLSSAGQELRV